MKIPTIYIYLKGKEYTMQTNETQEAIDKALNEDVDLSREEYAAKKARADEITAAHGVEGEAPLSEEERCRRMLMNFMGSMINITMALLSSMDEVNNSLVTLNNNIVALAGGTDGRPNDAASGD